MAHKFDPILVEAVKNESPAITEEWRLRSGRPDGRRWSRLEILLPPCVAGQGRLIGQSYQGPFKLAFFIAVVPRALEKYRGAFEPGDVIVVNDPYAGATHVPDVMILASAYWCGRLPAFTLTYSHHRHRRSLPWRLQQPRRSKKVCGCRS